MREGAAIAALEALAEPQVREVEGEEMRLVLRARQNAVQQACARARDRSHVRLKELERPAVEVDAEARVEILPEKPAESSSSSSSRNVSL